MRQERKHHMDGVFVLLLFCVFAACILSVLLTGAGAYRRLTERDRVSYDRRTAAQYIAAKVRQADTWNGVSVEKFGGQDTLALAEEIDGETYLTRIYYYDGYIRELFSSADMEAAPEDGEKIIEANDLRLTSGPAHRKIIAEITDGAGETARLVLALRSGKGAAE